MRRLPSGDRVVDEVVTPTAPVAPLVTLAPPLTGTVDVALFDVAPFVNCCPVIITVVGVLVVPSLTFARTVRLTEVGIVLLQFTGVVFDAIVNDNVLLALVAAGGVRFGVCEYCVGDCINTVVGQSESVPRCKDIVW